MEAFLILVRRAVRLGLRCSGRCGAALVLSAVLTGCAAQWQQRPGTAAQPAAQQMQLAFQKISTTPDVGVTPVTVAELQPGDILFSAQDGWMSTSLRLFGNSAVSHAFLYLGDGQAAEAVRHGGVRIIRMEQAQQENSLLVAYRRPGIGAQDAAALRVYSEQLAGRSYNYWGIVRQSPYTITRKVCELPVLPRAMRELCASALALVQVGPGEGERFFCSEFVVNAFNHIHKPLTSVPPVWVSPADLLHMRSGDVPAIPTKVALQYIGHLRCTPSPWNPSCQVASTVPEMASTSSM